MSVLEFIERPSYVYLKMVVQASYMCRAERLQSFCLSSFGSLVLSY